MKETNVTIISTNLNKKILYNYNDYYIIDKSFTYEELLNKKKVIFYNVLNDLSDNLLKNLFEYLENNNIKYIVVTNNIELSLYSDYLIVCDKEKILIEGNTIEVLKNDKLLKRLGFNLPFIIDLSILLKDYDLVNEIFLDKEGLVDKLWK